MTEKVLKTVCAGVGFVGGAAHVPSFRKVPNSQLYGVLARKGRGSEEYAIKYKEKILAGIPAILSNIYSYNIYTGRD